MSFKSFSPVAALQLVNEFWSCVSRPFLLQNVWNHLWSQQHKCEVCTIACCVHSSEGALYEVCLPAKSTTFYQLQMPTHTTAQHMFCLSCGCVLVIFLRGKPCTCLSCSTPVVFSDQFSGSLGAVNQASPTVRVCCVLLVLWGLWLMPASGLLPS